LMNFLALLDVTDVSLFDFIASFLFFFSALFAASGSAAA
jgi:hypothetical protein